MRLQAKMQRRRCSMRLTKMIARAGRLRESIEAQLLEMGSSAAEQEEREANQDLNQPLHNPSPCPTPFPLLRPCPLSFPTPCCCGAGAGDTGSSMAWHAEHPARFAVKARGACVASSERHGGGTQQLCQPQSQIQRLFVFSQRVRYRDSS